MSIAMEYRGPALAAAVGDWRATFFAGQAFLSNPGGADWAVSVVDGVAYDGTETLVTLRSAVLTEAFTAAQVGLNPAGDVQAHAGRHKAGGLDPLAHADLAGVASGSMAHAQLDAYLAGLSEVVSDVDADLAAETTARQAHEAAANPHSGSASLGALASVAEAAADIDADLAAEVSARQIFQASVDQTLLDQQAALDDAVDALETAVNLRALAARAIGATFPIQGGGSLEADRTLTLALAVVSELLGYGVTLSGKVVTDQILKAATKLLISTNTTVYVATTGSDGTGTGLAGAPFASIAKALSSLAGMLIASGVVVTIQVADGTYTISSTITVNHPDADKIQILGNISAETSVAIASIDTTAKTITIAGNYVSNADATKNIQNGDFVGLTGSSTSGLNGAYLVSGVIYNGTNTVITCSAETITSATVGGGVVRILPCQKCVLNVASGVTAFYIKTQLGMLSGFRINSAGGTAYGVSTDLAFAKYQMTQCVLVGFTRGISLFNGSFATVSGIVFRSCAIGVYGNLRSTIYYTGYVIHDTCSAQGIYLQRGSWANAVGLILRGAVISPAADTEGNNKSFISTGGDPVVDYIPKSLLASAGDMIVATAAGVAARLGVGSDGQVLTPISGVLGWGEAPVGGECRLDYTSATMLTLSRYDGYRLVIDNVARSIQSTGATLANTGVADTTYYIYSYWTGLYVSLEASTAAYTTDSRNGINVKNGDPTRTLVGMARTNSSGQWVDSATQRFVLSYYNRRPKLLRSASGGSEVSTTSTSYVLLSSAKRVEFLTWGDGPVLSFCETQYKNTVATGAYVNIYADGSSIVTSTTPLISANSYVNFNFPFQPSLTLGYHYIDIYVAVWTGTGTFNGAWTFITSGIQG